MFVLYVCVSIFEFFKLAVEFFFKNQVEFLLPLMYSEHIVGQPKP